MRGIRERQEGGRKECELEGEGWEGVDDGGHEGVGKEEGGRMGGSERGREGGWLEGRKRGREGKS